MVTKRLIVYILISVGQSRCPPEYAFYRNESCFAVKYFGLKISIFETIKIY